MVRRLKTIVFLSLLLAATKSLADNLVCPEGTTATRDVTKHLVCVSDPTPIPPTPVPTATPKNNATPQPTATPKVDATPQPTSTPKVDATPQPTATPPTYRSLWTSNTGGNKLAVNSTSYMNVSSGLPAVAVEKNVSTFVSIQFTATALACSVDVAPGGTSTWVINLRDNGATSPLGCTILSGATTCVDNVHSQVIPINHAIDYRILPVTSPVASAMHCALQVSLPSL